MEKEDAVVFLPFFDFVMFTYQREEVECNGA